MTMPGTDVRAAADQLGLRSSGPWWREPEVGLLLLLVLLAGFLRLDALSVRGEESRWALIGTEMMASGNWIVPRQQGEPFLSRPPLQNWAMAAVGFLRGSIDVEAIRLPSVLGLLFTVLLIYAYSRCFLSRLGALAAAVAYATMGQVLQLARLGETDSLFTLFLSGSLLIWHYGQLRRWPEVAIWVASYGLAALASLTKGPQGPVYFGLSVLAFSAVTRRWRWLFRWPHLAGILAFVLIEGVWLGPFYSALGWPGVRRMFCNEVSYRFADTRWITCLKHLVTYPAELLLGCLLPWSVLLLAYGYRGFRRRIGDAWEPVLFLAGCLAVAFPTCWLVPGARTRYFMPLFPCIAPLIGLVVQRCCEAGTAETWASVWPRFLTGVSIIMAGAGIVIAAATALDDGSIVLGQPGWFAAVYLAAALVLAAATHWSGRLAAPARATVGVLSLGAFLGLSWTGVVTNVLIRTSEPTAEAVAELKRQLPADARLVSMGRVDHIFAYHYGEPIPLVRLGGPDEPWPAEANYFCFDNSSPPEAAPPWEQIAAISCERHSRPRPDRYVVVGRRLPAAETAVARRPSRSD